MRLPAKTNVGMARRTQCWVPATRLDGSFCSEKLPIRRPRKPDRPSAKTMGMDSAARTTNEMPTAPKSMLETLRSRETGPPPAPAVGDGRRAVDHDQHAADHRREVEPAQVEIQRGRERLAVELGHLPAEDRHQRPEPRDEEVVRGEHRPARPGREAIGDHLHREVDAASDADRRADEGHPGEAEFADLLAPEEPDAREDEDEN